MHMCVECHNYKKKDNKSYQYLKKMILFFGLKNKKDAPASFQGCRRMNNLLLLHSAVTWSHSVSTAHEETL